MLQFVREIKAAHMTACLAGAGILIVLWAGSIPVHAQAQPALAEGQKVEVREGDTWSAATIVKKEGRKFLIHYDGSDASNDEWLTADRIRLPGRSGASTGPAAAAPKPFAVGEKIEFKSGPFWNKGIVVNTRGKWYFIQHENSRDREWVEPWRIRKLGSTEDPIGWVDSYGAVRNGQGPPREDPGESPLPGESTKDMLKRQAAAKFDAATPLTPADRSKMAEVAPGTDPGTPFVPDPEPKAAHPPMVAPLLLAAAPKDTFWMRIDNVFITADGSAAGLMIEAAEERWFERVDLVLGRSMGRMPLPPECRALDFSADGKLLATCPKRHSGSERVDIWNVQSAEPRQVVSFQPDEDDNGEVKVAQFIGSDHILTFSSRGRMILWDLKARAIWSMQISFPRPVAFSPNHRQFATWTDSTLTIFDTLTGKTLRSLPTPVRQCEALAFRPDGAQLALCGEDTLVVHDLLSGVVVENLNPQIDHTRTLSWVNDGYILAGGMNLIGLREQMLVWVYTKMQSPKLRRPADPRRGQSLLDATVGVAAHGRYWYGALTSPDGNGRPILASTVLPDDHARAVMATMNLSGQMAIQPGVTVSLEVNLPADIKDSVDLALKSALADNGVKVAAGQPIKLVASTEQGQSKEMIYVKGMFLMPMPIGGKPPADAVHMNVAEVTSSLAFTDSDGHKLWERTSVQMPPQSVRMKKDQSIQDAVTDGMKPTPWFFVRTPIPKFVPKASQPKGFGTSELTGQGAVPEE